MGAAARGRLAVLLLGGKSGPTTHLNLVPPLVDQFT